MCFNQVNTFKTLFILVLILTQLSCGGGLPLGTGTSTTGVTTVTLAALPNGITLPALTGPNVLPLTVNGSTCSADSYQNKPCVSVTICDTNDATHCTTVNDILVDTGSYGLRVFKSLVPSLSLTPLVGASSDPLYECVEYGDGSTEWGPVVSAQVKLGGESAVTVPIQLIDATNAGSNCGAAPETTPSIAGLNGILGIGVFKEDCGLRCASTTVNGNYFTCNGSSCSNSKAPLSKQVTNPIALLPVDNNGSIIQLPSIALTGASAVNGYLVLGIDTRSNNSSAGVTRYQLNSTYGEMLTVFNNTTYASFLDSGSNGYYFPAPSGMIDCSTQSLPMAGFMCPASTIAYTATNRGYTGSPSVAVTFAVANAYSLSMSGNSVFNDIAGSMGGAISQSFDWGLPFYLGRNVYTGIESTTSNLGTGPYVAY